MPNNYQHGKTYKYNLLPFSTVSFTYKFREYLTHLNLLLETANVAFPLLNTCNFNIPTWV
jgi:hypothetical protein